MRKKQVYSLDSNKVAEAADKWLKMRGVTLEDMSVLVKEMQLPYYPELTDDICIDSVVRVLSKREVQNAILTGIQLDMLAEQKKLMQPLQDMLENDEGLYGCDEVLAFSIVNVYGSIGFTNFGYIDKVKPGIVGRLNDKKREGCHTFLDDIVGAIVAAASSRIAHRKQEAMEQQKAQQTE